MGCFLSPSHHFLSSYLSAFFCLFVFLSFRHISWLVYIPQFMIEYMINSQHMYVAPCMAGDDSVAMSHPDALPDLLLDLVVVRVGGRQHLPCGF